MAVRRSRSAADGRSSNAVVDFLEKLEHPHKPAIEALRSIILRVDSRIREEVKWNAPSFYITEHFATFKLRPLSTVQIVLHTGAKVKSNAGAVEIDDPEGLLTWPATDRCLATFSGMEDVELRGAAFEQIVRQWIARTSVAES